MSVFKVLIEGLLIEEWEDFVFVHGVRFRW